MRGQQTTVAWTNPADPAPIRSLRGSPTLQLSTDLYLRHHDSGTGSCRRCGQRTPCPASRHAAAVIQAAGEDPPPQHAPAVANPVTTTDDARPPTSAITGYHLGGVGKRAEVPYFDYQR